MWNKGEVVERVDWNDKLFSLKINVPLAPFIAGQFIKLSQVIDGKRIGRAYSLVNAPNSEGVEILAVAVEEGQLSPHLQQLKVGDPIDVSTGASGYMTLNEISVQGRHLWLISTGTAVGPFISILETAEPWQRFEKLILVYGVRQASDLAYIDKLNALERQYPDQFKLVLSVTRETYPDALSCRISTALESGMLEEKVGLTISSADSQVMLCGNPDMITDTNKLLLDLGLQKNLRRVPGQITVEKYW